MKAFDIHGLRLRVEVELPALSAGIEDLLQRFPEAALTDGEFLRVILRNGTGGPGPSYGGTSEPGGELLFSSAWDSAIDLVGVFGINLDVYRDGPCLLFDYHRHGRLIVDKNSGILSGHLAGPIDLHPAPLTSFFFLLPVSELLASRGLYIIHAAALEWNGRGVLIPADSGGGKTTCCVSLMRAGYRCLSDDKPFLRDNGHGITLLAFPEKIDVTERTVAFFPELSAAPAGALSQGYRKKQFYPEALYPGSTAESSRPAVILFPHISGKSRSRLERLSKARAFEALLPHGLQVLDRDRSARHFDLLARLVEGAECYRLHFGQDVQDLPRLVDPLLG